MSQQSSSATDPNFVIPEGNYKQGKALFEDMCRSCHKMRVAHFVFRVMEKAKRLHHWEASSEEKQEQPCTIMERP